ncbi:MAG TPA: hypothetical protein VF173_36690 [Thermoanaerobaculia bacterium]|nr:hypothetical protein [Thermoanaerobaculia bacterium]
MKEIFPAVTGSLAVLAALSTDAFSHTEPMVNELYDLDDRVAQAATSLLTGKKDAAASLAALRPEASELVASINKRAAQVMVVV